MRLPIHKLVSVIAPLLLSIFILVACSSDQGRSSETKSIRIGAIASLVGPAGEQGKNWLRGAQLAAKELKEGGLDVELIVEDDKSEPRSVVTAFQKLVRVDRVRGVIGGTWDYLGEAAYPLAKSFRIPFVTPTNPPEVLSPEAKRNEFVLTNSLTLENISLELEKLLRHLHVRTLGLVYPDLPFGQQQAKMVERLCANLSIPIISRYEFPVASLMSDTTRIAALKLFEKKPDLTFAVLDYNGLDLLTSEFAREKSFPNVVTTQHLDQAFKFSNDPSRYRSLYAIYPRVSRSDFEAKFEREFAESPKVFAHHGYDALKFLALALRDGVDFSSPSAKFTYDGLTGVHSLPAKDSSLARGGATVVTTRNGAFEELSYGPGEGKVTAD